MTTPALLAAVGLLLLLSPQLGPKVIGWLTPDHKCLPDTDAERIEMLMQLREADERFNGPDARKSINYCIECLTGTLETLR